MGAQVIWFHSKEPRDCYSPLSTALVMKIVAVDDYGCAFANSGARKKLEEAGHTVQATPEASRGEALVKALADADVVLITQQRTPMGASELRALPQLKFILNSGVNGSHLDMEAASEQGIRVLLHGQPDASATIEMTWALILGSARRLTTNVRSLHEGGWQSAVGSGLAGKTLGILGLGRIGSNVAKVGAAFGMRILATGRPGGSAEKEARENGWEFTAHKMQVFEQADFLTIHLKASSDTLGLVTAEDLAAMKPRATLINTSRSSLIAPGALEAALKVGR